MGQKVNDIDGFLCRLHDQELQQDLAVALKNAQMVQEVGMEILLAVVTSIKKRMMGATIIGGSITPILSQAVQEVRQHFSIPNEQQSAMHNELNEAVLRELGRLAFVPAESFSRAAMVERRTQAAMADQTRILPEELDQ